VIGHGDSARRREAKVKLVGPDWSASAWSECCGRLPGRLVFVDTTGASSPSCAGLAARGRVVAEVDRRGRAAVQTVFPEFFTRRARIPAADSSTRNNGCRLGKPSPTRSAAVRRGRAERKGSCDRAAAARRHRRRRRREAQTQARRRDGARTYLEPTPCWRCRPTTGSPRVRRRARLDGKLLEEMKARKASTLPHPLRRDSRKLAGRDFARRISADPREGP